MLLLGDMQDLESLHLSFLARLFTLVIVVQNPQPHKIHETADSWVWA